MSRAIVLVACAVLAGCPAPQPPSVTPPPAAYDGARKLVVLLVIDQLPQWAFAAKAPALTAGFDRLLREGAWHTGRLPSPAALTAPGHALLGTGEPPARSGILGNEWWDRSAARIVGSVEDGATRSAHRLRVPGLGDAIAAARTGAKAVAVSLKDRSAILTLGHAGTPIWYDPKQVAFTTLGPPPAWLAAHVRAHPITPHLDDVWTPLDPVRLATLSGTVDAQPGEIGDKTFGPTFPHALAATKDPADAVLATPLGNQLVLDVALAAIDGEQLGGDAAPDLLVISLSAHDYVGHGWGQESWEAWDMMLRLDATLADFLAALDAKVGAGQWAMLVTSDHGAAPLPERSRGGRIGFTQLKDAANAAAATELGPGAWIANAKFPNVYFTPALLATPAKERGKAIHKVLLALRAFPGIAMADRTASFAGDCDKRTGDAFAICSMLDPERSGDLFYLPAEHWIAAERGDHVATAHGSWNAYDLEVPVIMLPFGHTPQARATAPSPTTIPMVRIATVLAGWLGVTPPTNLPRDPR